MSNYVNTDAKCYDTLDHLLKQGGLWKDIYTDFKSSVVSASIIPGLKKTIITNTGTYTNMIPQGLCVTDTYIFITAYEIEHQKSALYILDKKNGSYITMVGFSGKKIHAGGVAFNKTTQDLWVCGPLWVYNGKFVPTLIQIKQNTILSKPEGTLMTTNDYNLYYLPTIKETSYISIADNRLHIGQFHDSQAEPYSHNEPIFYTTSLQQNGTPLLDNNTYNKPCIRLLYQTRTPNDVQGMTFFQLNTQKYIVFSHSYGRTSEGTNTDRGSKISIYKFSSYYDDFSTDTYLYKKIAMPVMIEQICFESIGNTSLYTIFESASNFYTNDAKNLPSNYIDRVITIDFMKLFH